MASQFPPQKVHDQVELMEFPCEYGLKVFGLNNPEFEAIVLELVQQHCEHDTEFRISSNQSKKGKYQSLTITFMAQSREQMDAIYMALTDCEQVVMSL